ncbi:hypothetical protein INT48_009104 [Thamnidium elegans]|uniref:GLTSCR protein conserved domain-containing protein n=1 Tax=Thamnidium elegans TaxID=101142 RepID=A0A8H7SS54_9FUNG|nr:hypothetical protein INT48_009104 [Thamnidium elegans]
MDNNKNPSLIQQQTSNTDDEEIITQLTLAGLKVLMVRKRDQIIYKLPDNMQVASIGEEQRQQLMKEIQALHQATMAAAASAQQKQQQQNNDVKPIAPKNEAPSLDTPPQPTAAEADAIKETARKLREELEQQQYHMKQQQQMFPYDSNPSSPHDSSKTTRRYNKTGKYSKKKQQQLQQQLHQQLQQPYLFQQQQHQLTQQQLLALQQSLQINSSPTPSTPMSTSAASTPVNANTPTTAFPFPPVQQQQLQQQQQQNMDQSVKASPAPTPPPQTPVNQRTLNQSQPDSILSKRLPEEEIQHREVKKRCLENLLSDQKAVTAPDYETPFTSIKDAMDRLLPYHIYQYPKSDLDANKIPLERQDHTMIEIFKCQTELFDKHSTISKKIENNGGNVSIKILVERQVLAEQRQKFTEEQARVAAEQAAQHQELMRVQAEKARLAAIAEQENPATAAANYANGLAQASALLTNPQFQNQYSQLSPELQQRLQRNREQLVALINKQQQSNNNNTP